MDGYGRVGVDHILVRALYDHVADDATGLNFHVGEVMKVLTQLDSGWWDAMNTHKVRGWIPSNYVEIITEEDANDTSDRRDNYDLEDVSEGEDDYDMDVVPPVDVEDGNEVSTADVVEGPWLPQVYTDGQIYYYQPTTGKTSLHQDGYSSAATSFDQDQPGSSTYLGQYYAGATNYEGSISEADGMSTSRCSLSNGISPSTSTESLTLAGSTRYSNSSNLSLVQQGTTPKQTSGTNFMGTSRWTRTPNVPQRLFGGGNGVQLTWPRILEDIRRSVERYKQAMNADDRGDFVRRVEDVSDQLRLMFAAASGTTDDHFGIPSILTNNSSLSPRFTDVMRSFPKLVMSTHIATADWSPPESRQGCLKEAKALLEAAENFVEVARHQRGEEIPRLMPGFMDNRETGGAWRNNNRLSILSTSDAASVGRNSEDSFYEANKTLDRSLLGKLEDLRSQMASGVRVLLEQLTFEGNIIDIQQHRKMSEAICNTCGKVLSLCRPWLAVIEQVDLLPVASARTGAKDLAEFANRKQTTYNLIGELIVSCQTVAAPLADEWTTDGPPPLDERLTKVKHVVEQLDKNSSEVAESLRILLDNAPIMENPGRRSSTMSQASSRSVPGRMITGISDAARARDSARSSATNSKIGEHFGDAERKYTRTQSNRQSQEVPEFLRLDHEGEVIYDPKATTITIRGGSLTGLVEQLTRHDRYDPSFNNTFLLTYRSFTTAAELFAMLISRWNIQPIAGISAADIEVWKKKKQSPIRFRLVNVLKSWLDTYWMEDTHKAATELLQRIRLFVKETVIPDMEANNLPGAQPLLGVLDQRISGEEVSSKKLIANSNVEAPTPILPKNLYKNNNKGAKIIDIDPLELARQLTIMESNLYRKIKPQEALEKTWYGKKKNSDGNDHAPNIKALILHANRVTNWVAWMIIMQDKVKDRVNMIKHFINVADRCLHMANFSTLTSIISAFGAAPIHRLGRTWTQVSKASITQLERMKTLMGTARNFAEYRAALAHANPPCIPFFGVYLTDLTFIEDGIPSNMRKSDLINFSKRVKTAEVISDIEMFQNVTYPFTPVKELHEIMIPVINEAPDVGEQYERSLRLEPREREDEKIARLLSESGFL